MRVGVDLRPLQGASAFRGIGTTVRGLVPALVEAAPGVEWFLAVHRGRPRPPEARLGRPRDLPSRDVRAWLAPVRQVLVCGRALARDDFDALLLTDPDLGSPPAGGARRVGIAHDVIPFLFPGEYLDRGGSLRARAAGLYHRLRLRWYLDRLVRCDRVLAVSDRTASDLADLTGADPSTFGRVHWGVDPRFDPEGPAEEAGRSYLLWVGGMDARKLPGMALEALARLRGEGRDLELRVASRDLETDLPEAAAFRRATRRLGLEDAVRALGHVETDRLARLYRGAAALCHPSAYEGFGLPCLEALASGCPVVAAAGGAVPEVVGDAGLLVPPRDPDALADALARTLDEPEETAARVRRGLARAREFTWERAADEVLDALGVPPGLRG